MIDICNKKRTIAPSTGTHTLPTAVHHTRDDDDLFFQRNHSIKKAMYALTAPKGQSGAAPTVESSQLMSAVT